MEHPLSSALISSEQKVSIMHNVISSDTTNLGTLTGWAKAGATSIFDQGVILSIILTAILMIGISVYYYIKIKKLKPNESPKGFLMIVEWYFLAVENMLMEMFGTSGDQYKKLTPYFAFMLFYFLFGDIMGVFGFQELAQNYTIPLTNGIICLIGIFYFGIKHQRWLFVRHFFFTLKINGRKIPVMINPLEVIGLFTPIISLTFRLWGNIFASVIVIGFVYIIGQLIGPSSGNIEQPLNMPGMILVGGFILAPLPHLLFDLFIDPIQAYVFVILNMTYWSLRVNGEEAQELNERLAKKRALKQNLKQVPLQVNA